MSFTWYCGEQHESFSCSGVLNCNYARLPMVMSELDKKIVRGWLLLLLFKGQCEGKRTQSHVAKRDTLRQNDDIEIDRNHCCVQQSTHNVDTKRPHYSEWNSTRRFNSIDLRSLVKMAYVYRGAPLAQVTKAYQIVSAFQAHTRTPSANHTKVTSRKWSKERRKKEKRNEITVIKDKDSFCVN